MSDEDKKPYTLLATKDKERYSKEVCVGNFSELVIINLHAHCSIT